MVSFEDFLKDTHLDPKDALSISLICNQEGVSHIAARPL